MVGFGEATGGLETKPIEAKLHEISRFVIGEDPLCPTRLWQKIYKCVYLNTSVAMSAVEIACWDILGKTLHAPIWKLLGGKQRPRLRVYANGWYKGPRDPEFFGEAASRVKEMGYTALKFDPFGAAHRFLDRTEEELSIQIIRAVRKAVGNSVDILIEGHDRFSVSTAIHLARRMEEFQPMWFETPVMSTDIEATLQVARSIGIPVATGERCGRLSDILRIVSDRSISIVQPETLKIGGISGAYKGAATDSLVRSQVPILMTRIISTLSTLLTIFAVAQAQDWTSYGGDPGGTKYSGLEEINRENVNRLRPAWVFHAGDISDGSKWPTRSAFEATPLVVDGTMYVTTPFSRIIALDSETGKEVWSFDPRIDPTESANLFINRGAAYWSDGSKHRVFLGTLDGRLFSLMAESGKLDDSFGNAGWVDLRSGAADNFPNRRLGMTSPPAIFGNVVICGSLVSDGEPQGPLGVVRGFDARTGKLLWTFYPVAQGGEPGNETWIGDAWKGRGGANAWAPLTVDTARGIVFLPLTSPSADLYGADRPGAGLFGDSLVALDATTGKHLWHFQTLHHDIWDYDLPAQPTLVQVLKDGKVVDAVAQVTKTGYTFVFDRVTGTPIFPIEEVRVPKSEVPDEAAYPTQPRPLLPPPFARQSMTASELGNVTPETRAYCQSLLEGAVLGPMYTPISFQKTILFPGTLGGANWGGASFDPETHTLYVNSMDVAMIYRMYKRPEGPGPAYRAQGAESRYSRFWDPDLIPCQRPPWAFLTAIDLDTGQFRWRTVLGVVDKLIQRGLPPTGAPNIGGSLVTAGGLVFIGATNDSRFRAFDKDTGKEIWVTKLPASAHATPMTFRGKKTGKQFVVIAAGGGNKFSNVFSDSLIAFALPSQPDSQPLVSYSRPTTRVRESVPLDAARTHAAAEIFSHAGHASLQIECAFCHAGAVQGEKAGFPQQSKCMQCHRTVNPEAPTIRMLAALPANRQLTPVAPLYQLPDFIFFRHDRHAAKDISCATCHGDVGAQEHIQPVLAMKMKGCVDCHQANRAAVACTVCHALTQ